MCWNLAISEDEHIIAGIENPKKKKKKKLNLKGFLMECSVPINNLQLFL